MQREHRQQQRQKWENLQRTMDERRKKTNLQIIGKIEVKNREKEKTIFDKKEILDRWIVEQKLLNKGEQEQEDNCKTRKMVKVTDEKTN